eukprot:jgi/Undpi1/10973/HiC_scaffold_30.g13274.m1
MDGLQQVDEEYEERMRGFESDCGDGKGNAVACHQVGEFLSVVKNDFKRAGKIFGMNCEDRGHGPSCFNLGRFLLAGKGVEQSDAKAEKVFDSACGKDHQPACLHLGFLHLYGGDGFKRDIKKAHSVLDSSCQGGLADSCNMLAKQLLRRDGKGPIPRDPPRAQKLLEQGCAQNHGPSCYNLTVMYKKGDVGVASNYKKYRKYREQTEKLAAQLQGVDGNKQA